MSATKKSFQYGDHTVIIETGELARQADGAVIVTMSETVVLVTAVGAKKAMPGRDFFPLTVNYQEKTYAAGVRAGRTDDAITAAFGAMIPRLIVTAAELARSLPSGTQ